VLDTALGTVNHVDIKTGAKKVVAQLETALDNLAIDSKDRIFVSNMADNGIQEVDVKTGRARQVIKGRLSSPVGLSVVADGKGDTIYVADSFAYRSVDGVTGKVTDIQRSHSATALIAYASGVSASSEHVLVSNSNGSLQKYQRSTGKLLKEWKGVRASGAVELPDGDVLIAQGGALVRINDKDEKKTVVEGVGRAQSLALSKDGVYFVDAATGHIHHASFAGAKRSVTTAIKLPQGLALDASGRLITVDFAKQRLVAIDPASGAITELATQLPIGVRGLERAERPIGLTVGQAGDIYLTSDIENSIYKLSKQ
jgi:sugar lactone lactonase YvrE